MAEPEWMSSRLDDDGSTRIETFDGRQLTAACNTSPTALLSSRELLQAALGSCIVASLVPLLARHGADPGSIRVNTSISDTPGKDSAIDVHIALPALDDALLRRCRRAAEHCPVRKMLGVPVNFQWLIQR